MALEVRRGLFFIFWDASEDWRGEGERAERGWKDSFWLEEKN